MHLWRRLYVGPVLLLFMAAILIVTMVLTSGSFLILDGPRRSDVIVVLAGETDRRPARGFELLGQDFAPHLVLDVPAAATVYQWKVPELAQKYIQAQPRAAAASLCPIHARSTKGEAQDVSRCLERFGAHRVLLVTSDYHTRRALSVFQRVWPQYNLSVAAAFDDREFGAKWWRHRQWAKINFDEWIRLVWWELVDRWR